MADAIRFVSAGVGGGTGLYYVHSDHLGTPQKMTDGNQVVVWDAVFKPFGETHSITGTTSNNQRFPGQYADAESGFSYNYFRDYDPRTGRYVESDPIGLGGGLNTYIYVVANPLKFIDPNGYVLAAPPGAGPQAPTPAPFGPNVAEAYGDARAPISGFYLELALVSEIVGNFSWTNCVRGCLLNFWDRCKQEYIVAGIGGNFGFLAAHQECFSICTFAPIRP